MIGVALDLLTLRLRYWIDGRPLDDMAKTLPAGKAWIPTVVITEAELEVILNPFCVSCDPDFSSGLVPRAVKELHEDGQSGGQRTFPAGLCEPLAALQSAFLASLLQEYLVVVDVPPAETEGGDAVAEALKRALVTKPKKNIEEAKQDESAEVAEAEPAEQQPVLPQYETHSVPRPQIGKPKATASAEPQDEKKDDAIKVALLKFDGEQAALRYLVGAA